MELRQDHRDHQDPQDLRVLQDRQEKMENQEPLVFKGHQVIQEIKALMDFRGLRDHQDQEDPRENLALVIIVLLPEQAQATKLKPDKY